MDLANVHNGRGPTPFQPAGVAPESQAQRAAGARVLDFLKGATTLQQLQVLQYLYGGEAPGALPGFAGFFDAVRRDLNQANRAFIRAGSSRKAWKCSMPPAGTRSSESKCARPSPASCRPILHPSSSIQQADADARRADEEAAQEEEETVAPGFAATVAGEAAAAPGSGAVQGLSMPLTLIGRLLEEITPGSGASATSACTSDCSTSAASRLPPSQ